MENTGNLFLFSNKAIIPLSYWDLFLSLAFEIVAGAMDCKISTNESPFIGGVDRTEGEYWQIWGSSLQEKSGQVIQKIDIQDEEIKNKREKI